MGTGLNLLYAVLVIAGFIGIFWWMFSLSAKSNAKRKQELAWKKMSDQPWADDRAIGRGNR